MGSALSPLRTQLIALQRLLLRIVNPKFIRTALTGLVRRLALCVIYARAKLFDKRRIDSTPGKTIGNANDDEKTAHRDEPAYTIVRNGAIISLSGTASSLFPYSSHGIRNTRSTARAGQPGTRNSSRNRGSETASIAGSTWELPLNPTGSPSRPPSRNRGSDTNSFANSTYGRTVNPVAPPTRPPSQLRNPQRQFSSSLPDLNNSTLHRIDTDNLSWVPWTPHRSPPPGIGIELASPREDHTWDCSGSELHAQFPPDPIPAEQPTYSSPCPSPPPGIQVEATSPIEISSPLNLSQTSLQIPSEPSEPSDKPTSRPISFVAPDSSEPSDKLSLRPISPAASDSQSSRHEVVLDTTLGQPVLRYSETGVHIIKAVLPEDNRRYSRRTKIPHKWCRFELEPMTTVFETSTTPPGWLRLVHPEGARYFYHENKNIYTDSDLTDMLIYERLMNDVTRLDRLIPTYDKPFPKGASLMIDVSYDDERSLQTEYYYADHNERVVFFLHPANTDDMPCTFEVKGPKSYPHLGFAMQAQYWYFVSLYPRCCTLTDELLCELRDIVLFLIGDHMTSPYSTAPYTMADLFQILSLTDGMEKNIGKRTAGTMSLFARHMFIFYHSKYLNCYGETFSRVERNFSIFGDPLDKRTWLVRTLSPILFSAPDVHLRNLQKMWVDGMLHRSVWEDSTKKLNEEWQEFIFFATVMLTSNVGYLAIQSVDIDMGAARSPGQIASYLSVVANIGSIILGLLLMRQNRTKRSETADEVQKFLTRRNHPLLGLETLAILYSLPYALLMWGVVAFLVAFCCLFFQNSTAESRAWVGSLSLAVAILIIWCIVTSWESHAEEEVSDRPLVRVESQIEDAEDDIEKEDEKRSKQGIREILDIIRHIPDLVYRRGSVDSEKTAV